MKLTRAHLGKVVEVVWRDPGTGHTKRRGTEAGACGEKALATWKERGVIDDLTDGVASIVHSEGLDACYVGEDDRSVELSCTWVPEALIERIVVYEARPEALAGGDSA